MVNDQSPNESDTSGASIGWAALGTLIAGILVWGGIGWLIGAWLGVKSAGLVTGMVIGTAASTYLIVKKYS